MRRVLGCLFCLLFLQSPALLAQGKLQQVREEVEKPDEEEKPKARDCDHGCRPCDEEEVSIGGKLAGFILLSPFILPHAALGDNLALDGFFPGYPYQHDRHGYMWAQQVSTESPEPFRSLAGRFSVENGNDFDGLNRVGAHLFLETASRFGIQSRFDYYHENLPGGRCDELYLGSTELTYRFAQHPSVQMYAGLGFRFMDDRARTHFGFNFTYGVDIFPVKPFISSLSIDLGNLGDAGVVRLRGTIGVNYKRLEIFTGYDSLSIGSVNLHGPLVGLRLWY